MDHGFGVGSLCSYKNMMAQQVADEIFLMAFDKAIEQTYQNLASRGVDDDAIWAACRQATITMGRLVNDVEDEQSTRRIPKKAVRSRRSVAGSCRKELAN